MAHISGVFLIDCPASALNNFGSQVPMTRPQRYDNYSTVKYFRTREGVYPYASAQAFRFWLRETLKMVDGWTESPIFRGENIAYTDANPLSYAEDDLFGYMRAPGDAKEEEAWPNSGLTGQQKNKKTFVTLTRVSPFKVSTLISIAPVGRELPFDFGSMSRGEGVPVLHSHEFYRTTLVGQFSLDLRLTGRFYHVDRTGFRHLDSIRKKMAEEKGLKTYDNGRAYELDLETRTTRVKQLLEGLARITGGAKQALHYTDVAPKLLFLGVAKGGNHLFGTAIGATSQGTPKIQDHALLETGKVFQEELLSGFYAGLAQGYLDEQRATLEKVTQEVKGSFLGHPVEAIRRLSADLEKNAAVWLE